MRNKLKGVCFGEILFDVFPDHKKIGGAPFNVASRIKSFGGDISIISAIGNDDDGKKIVEYIDGLGIKINTIQVKDNYPTGLVYIILNKKGNASYDINYPSAWDKIEPSVNSTSLVEESDFLIYGSLASRDAVSRNTLYQLLEVAKYKIFDINLRFPHYTRKMLLTLMNNSDFIKFNDEELYEISGYLNLKFKSLEHNIEHIAKVTQTDTICVTKGSLGAILYYKNQFFYNGGYHVKVVDTVGSGDSFLSSLITKLFTEKNPQRAIDFACAVGAIVAQSEGANPIISETEINKIISGN